MQTNQDRQHMEHRWGTRVEIHAPVDLLTHDGGFLQASVKNASLSGAFVNTDQRLPLFSRVALRPVLNAHGEWLEGCVVRVEDSGMALEWLDPGLHAVSVLLSLRRDSPRPQPLDAACNPRGSSSVTWIHQDHPARANSSRT
jgi:hypothetical protein